MAQLNRPLMTAGIAVAGAGLWLAVAPDASAAPEVDLAPLSPAASASCGDVWCSELFGSAVSAHNPPKLAAAAAMPNPIGSLIRVFIGNGTADNPNAGLLIGGTGRKGADGNPGGTGPTGPVGQPGNSG